MNSAPTILRREHRRIVYLALCCIMIAWVPTSPLPGSPAEDETSASALRPRRKPGARDANWRPGFVEGAADIAGNIAGTFDEIMHEFCGGDDKLSSPALFMQEYGPDLARLCVPAARLACCTPLPGAVRYELIGRLTGTNTVRIGVAFGCNRAGLIETLTFDHPVVLPDGVINAAAVAIPVETVMRALATMRQGERLATEDLVVTHAATKITYANQDSTKAEFSFMVSGSAPTAYTSFYSTALTQFAITPMPLFDTNVVAHTFNRMYAGINFEKPQKYLHYFVTYDSLGHEHKDGSFVANLHDGMVDFEYKIKMDNEPRDIVTSSNYDAMRAYAATNQHLRGLGFGAYVFRIGTETHTVSNVPLLGRVTKSSSSVTKTKVKTP